MGKNELLSISYYKIKRGEIELEKERDRDREGDLKRNAKRPIQELSRRSK